MNIFLRHGNLIYVSSATSTIDGQLINETLFGLHATPMGIVHGLTPTWQGLLSLLMRCNAKGVPTTNNDAPLVPTDYHQGRSLILFTDNNIKHIQGTFDRLKNGRRHFAFNEYPLNVRERIIGATRFGQAIQGHWEAYKSGFVKAIDDRDMSILAFGCLTGEEFFRRVSYLRAPAFSTYHRFKAEDLMDLSGELRDRIWKDSVYTEVQQALLAESEEEQQSKLLLAQAMDSLFLTLMNKHQDWLDEKLIEIAEPLEKLL